jgi:hypothetical protein
MIWEVFKRMSWEMTKKLISSNKLWYMYRYHDYMLRKIGELGDNVKNVGAIKSSTERSVNDKIKELKRSKEEAISLQERKAANTVIKIVQSKVALLQQQIDSFLPRLDYIKNQEKSLIELYDIWKADTEILKNTLDAKAEEYEMMKQLSSASDSAMAFLKKDSPELRDYNLSLKMIEQSVNEYTSNVENFQREVAPTIVRLSAQSDANADEGAKLIEEYKQARIKL